MALLFVVRRWTVVRRLVAECPGCVSSCWLPRLYRQLLNAPSSSEFAGIPRLCQQWLTATALLAAAHCPPVFVRICWPPRLYQQLLTATALSAVADCHCFISGCSVPPVFVRICWLPRLCQQLLTATALSAVADCPCFISSCSLRHLCQQLPAFNHSFIRSCWLLRLYQQFLNNPAFVTSYWMSPSLSLATECRHLCQQLPPTTLLSAVADCHFIIIYWLPRLNQQFLQPNSKKTRKLRLF